MPAVIDTCCSWCGKPTGASFYPSGAVRAVVYQCPCVRTTGRPHADYADGDAYLRPHYFMLRVVKAADRLSDCIAEFGEQKVGGKCLCDSCGEHVDELDGAIAAYKEIIQP